MTGASIPGRGSSAADPAIRPEASHHAPRAMAEGYCIACGTSVPGNEPECAFCRRQGVPPAVRRETALHWLLFLAAMAALFGGSALLL